MKVEYYKDERIFGEMPFGIVFIYNNKLYVKIQNEIVARGILGGVIVNAMSLSSYRLEYIGEDDKVQVCPNAVLKLTED